MKQPLAPGRSRARRLISLIVPCIIGVVGYLLPGIGLWVANGTLDTSITPVDTSITSVASLLGFALILLGWPTVIVAFVFFLIAVIRVLSEWRRARRHAAGKFTPAEQAERARLEHFASAWNGACLLRAGLIRGEVPPQIRSWDVVPNVDEVFFCDNTASYARFYGQDVAYAQSSGFLFGPPLFVAAGVVLSVAGNAARRSRAEAAAQTQWREHQTVRLLVSNQRLICRVGGQWLSFYYSGMSAVHPAVDRWTLVCQFDSTSPMLLNGPDVPTAALITMLMTHGSEAIEQHPNLALLG